MKVLFKLIIMIIIINLNIAYLNQHCFNYILLLNFLNQNIFIQNLIILYANSLYNYLRKMLSLLILINFKQFVPNLDYFSNQFLTINQFIYQKIYCLKYFLFLSIKIKTNYFLINVNIFFIIVHLT
jgi:hypothetical protein